ncbi:MAG: T9SS type A sorting domain-containing protein [Candidatus Zixiibacteriota bacterium]
MFLKTARYILIFSMLVFVAARSETFTVTSLNDSHDFSPGDFLCCDHETPDSGFCTLRAALEEAAALPGSDTIIVTYDTLSIRLNLGSLNLTDDSTVISGENRTAVDAVDNPLYTNTFNIFSSYNEITGLTIKRARNHGIYIEGAYNRIGGSDDSRRNVIIGNGIDADHTYGLCISGSGAIGNIVLGNYIGMYGNGTLIDGNRNGAGLIDKASDNVIGGPEPGDINLISGNDGAGVVIASGAFDNSIVNNIIGPDITGNTGPGNGANGMVLCEGAHNNLVGGGSYAEGNHISGNIGSGLVITGYGTDANEVKSNYFGADITGLFPLANTEAGVLISEGARFNLIGGSAATDRNLISGNDGDGVLISGSGTSFNRVSGNYIGCNYRGTGYLGNGNVNGAGITLTDHATENTIGGSTEPERNIISGNLYYGVFLNGSGTIYNRITGNFIGVNVYGTSSLPNGAGVLIRNGASVNDVGGAAPGEGNIISGNRGDIFPFSGGVIIYDPGTSSNRVIGNLIGTSADTTRALRNGSAGVIIGNRAIFNTIGGTTPAEANIICGNGSGSYTSELGRGVHIYGEGTGYNKIIGNYIGTTPAGATAITNTGHGIVISDAWYNEIGGQTLETGNIIGYNDGHGVLVTGSFSFSNLIRYNSFYNNDSLGIAVRDSAQENIAPPRLLEVTTNFVSGDNAPAYGTIDIYLADPDPSGTGEGRTHIGSGIVDADGSFTVEVPTLDISDTITTMVTDESGNSSAFSLNMARGVFTEVDSDADDALPTAYSLAQNYPNPFNPETRIEFSIPNNSDIKLTIFNMLGQNVKVLLEESRSAGTHTVSWDGTDQNGENVASGIYLYRLETEKFTTTKKMLLLR